MLMLLLLIAAPGTTNSQTIATVSTGGDFIMERELAHERPTVFCFYQTTSAADKAVVNDLMDRASKDSRVGLRLVKLGTLDSPAARQYEIRETPTLIVLDRFGNLKKRTSKVEEINPAVNRALKMARIKWVNESDPEAPTVYRRAGGGRFPVAGIIKTMSLKPEWMESIFSLASKAHFQDGYLPRRTKEMIATYVSAINHCKF